MNRNQFDCIEAAAEREELASIRTARANRANRTAREDQKRSKQSRFVNPAKRQEFQP